jgi:tRNA-binding EMAP/Myf-like protein
MITYDEFKKVEIRAGKILSAEKIPDTDKLLKLVVDFAETKEVASVAVEGQEAPVPVKVSAPRQIVSGISTHFPDPAVLVGKTCMFVTNLEPRTIKGYESNGMLFAVSTAEGGFSLLEPNETIPAGTKAA